MNIFVTGLLKSIYYHFSISLLDVDKYKDILAEYDEKFITLNASKDKVEEILR